MGGGEVGGGGEREEYICACVSALHLPMCMRVCCISMSPRIYRQYNVCVWMYIHIYTYIYTDTYMTQERWDEEFSDCVIHTYVHTNIPKSDGTRSFQLASSERAADIESAALASAAAAFAGLSFFYYY